MRLSRTLLTKGRKLGMKMPMMNRTVATASRAGKCRCVNYLSSSAARVPSTVLAYLGWVGSS